MLCKSHHLKCITSSKDSEKLNKISVRKWQGRKPLLDACGLQALRRHCITHRQDSVIDTKWAQEYFQKPLSVNTIRRAICRCQLKLYHAKRKPYVTLDHKTSHMGTFFEMEIYTSSESWIKLAFRWCMGCWEKYLAEIQLFAPVAQWLEHCVSSAKVVGSIPREHTYWQYKCIAWMHCKSLASAKCINVNLKIWNLRVQKNI